MQGRRFGGLGTFAGRVLPGKPTRVGPKKILELSLGVPPAIYRQPLLWRESGELAL